MSGCGKKPETPGAGASPAPTPDDPRALRIGFFIPLTGAQSSFGTDALRGANLAIDQINKDGGLFKRPLKLVVRDTESKPEVTADVVKELIEKDKVIALLGEIASDRSLVAAPIAQQHGIPMITPGATHQGVTAVGDFIFRVGYTDYFQAAAMSEFARSIDAKKAAILFDPSNPYSADLAAIFKTDFTAKGGTLAAEATYQTGAVDFSEQLNAIKARLPEVVFLPSYYKDAARIIAQARQLGLDMPFLGTDGWDSPEFLQVGGEAVNNCYFSSHFSAENKTPLVETFVAAYSAANNNMPPPPLAALAYDSVNLLVDALRRAEKTDATLLKDALAATKDFPGVTGTITFDENRNPTKPTLVIRVENGKFTYLETATSPTAATPTPAPSAMPEPPATPSPTAESSPTP